MRFVYDSFMRTRFLKVALTLVLAVAYASPTINVLKILDHGKVAHEKKRKGVPVQSPVSTNSDIENLQEVVVVQPSRNSATQFDFNFLYRDASRSIFTPPPRA
jgi:hypothetical protein